MWQKIKNTLRSFMIGRHGADQLSFATLMAGLIIMLISGFFRPIPIVALALNLVGDILYIITVFRMFSRNNEKRFAENRKYLEIRGNLTISVKSFFVRLKNIKKFKYYKCPECKALLRLPRKVGEVTVTCGKCHHQFKQRA